MNLLVFGLGRGRAMVERFIKEEHNIIGYSDSYAKIEVFNGNPFYKYEELGSIRALYDFIVIAIWNPKTAWEVSS